MACDRVFLEWFPGGQEGLEDCTVHRHVAVDRRNGLLASSNTPSQEIDVRTYADLPARYGEWAHAAGVTPPPIYLSPLGESWVQASRVGRVASLQPVVAEPEAPKRLQITSPVSGLRLLIDPEVPAEHSTVALSVIVEPAVEEVVWVVDGLPYRTVGHPYSLRWPLSPGEHTFQVRLPFGDAHSQTVKVRVE